MYSSILSKNKKETKNAHKRKYKIKENTKKTTI